MSKPILKTEHTDLPLRIPVAWRDFFDTAASDLAISRNSAICLAIKLGGPLLQRHITRMRSELRAECARMTEARAVYGILGLPPERPAVAELPHDERQTDTAKPEGGQGRQNRRCAGQTAPRQARPARRSTQ